MGQEVTMPDEPQNPVGGTRGVDRVSRRENRQHLHALEQAVYNGWQIPPDAAAALPREILAIATDPNSSPRDRIRATELIATLRRQDCEAAIDLDKILRLDAGAATENVAFVDLPEAALKAVADTIRARRCPAKPRKR
jgi:hypothetical protein